MAVNLLEMMRAVFIASSCGYLTARDSKFRYSQELVYGGVIIKCSLWFANPFVANDSY